jgi:hypothetical protein
MNKFGTIADETIMGRYGATSLSSGDGIHYQGWTFRCYHGPIAGIEKRIELAQHVSRVLHVEEHSDDSITLGQTHLHLPAMVFSSNFLCVSHDTSTTNIHFNAQDALETWALQHLQDGLESRIVKVPYAQMWAQKTCSESSKISDTSTHLLSVSDSPDSSSSVIAPEQRWEWTFSSDYCCSLNKNHNKMILSARNLNNIIEDIDNKHENRYINIKKLEESGINIELLQQKTDILFYNEITLYQDDLEDCGEVIQDIKIRVMPSCWFILCRMFRRVDGAVVTIRDTRLYHEFGRDSIFIEIKWQQKDLLPDMEQGMGSDVSTTHPAASRFPMYPQNGGPKSYDSENAANHARDVNAWSRLLPDICIVERLHKYYEIQLT